MSEEPERRPIYLWLDDQKVTVPDDEWDWVTTSDAAIFYLSNLNVVHLSLDHDLGIPWTRMPDYTTGKLTEEEAEDSGYEVVKWMEEHEVWPPIVSIHSQNPVGAANMAAGIRRGPYREPSTYFFKRLRDFP